MNIEVMYYPVRTYTIPYRTVRTIMYVLLKFIGNLEIMEHREAAPI